MILRRRGTPVLAVHGFDGYAARDCREFDALGRALPGRVRTIGFYRGDTNADVQLAGGSNTDTSIRTLGISLAQVVEDLDGPVDLLGHSMGGLIVQEALTELPTEKVRRVVMLGVPFDGLPSAVGTEVVQCRELSPGSDLLAGLASRGIRAELVVASEADEAVPIESALLAAGPQLRIPAARQVHHGDLLTDPQVLKAVTRALR